MNLLAHLHLGNHLPAVAAAGNFTADFCRTPGSTAFAEGVRFHRAIDAFTDSHPCTARARAIFAGTYRHFGGVLTDLAFDHCLSRSWSQWVPDLERIDFIDGCLQRMLDRTDELPTEARSTISGFARGKWIHRYNEIGGIGEAISRIAIRRPIAARIIGAEQIIADNFVELNSIFDEFYPEMIAFQTSSM